MNNIKVFRHLGFIFMVVGIIDTFGDAIITGIPFSSFEVGTLMIFCGILFIFQSFDNRFEYNEYMIEFDDYTIHSLMMENKQYGNQIELLESRINHLEDEITKINEGG